MASGRIKNSSQRDKRALRKLNGQWRAATNSSIRSSWARPQAALHVRNLQVAAQMAVEVFCDRSPPVGCLISGKTVVRRCCLCRAGRNNPAPNPGSWRRSASIRCYCLAPASFTHGDVMGGGRNSRSPCPQRCQPSDPDRWSQSIATVPQ